MAASTPRLAGAEEFVLSLSRAVSGGTVRLELRDEALKPLPRLEAPWTETVRFKAGIPHGQGCYVASLSFKSPGEAAPAAFSILGMEALVPGTAAEALALDVDTGNDIHVVNRPNGVTAATFRNISDEAGAWSGRIVLSDFFGKVEEIPFDCRLAPSETAAVPLPVPEKFGIYRVKAEIAAGDGSAATKTVQFAKLVPREATPRWPRGTFRPGVNYHVTCYPEADRRRLNDALVAMGAKLCRADLFNPLSVCPQEGVFDWEASEKPFAELEACGIDLDAIIYRCPKWARAEAWKTPEAEELRAKDNFPTRPGFFRDFCERLAARYGTRIAYYEVGNEWDMKDERVLPFDEAARIQREAYAGIKAGCQDAVCIPNGWALPIASELRHFRRPGFQRRFMDECRDAYDVYPLHLHGPFQSYRRDLGQVLDFRRKAGISQPWYANETALTSANGGEDAVAECVWQKMLYSWALGSTDYIWYNLRATGYNPADSQQGYGLMTADLHPRAGFASFSGLVHTFGLLKADGPVTDDGERFIARWSGEREGTRQIVFGGWNLAAKNGTPVRVRTDARAAYDVDLFGNRSPLPVVDGAVDWRIGKTPCALLLDSAASAEIDAASFGAATDAGRELPVPAAPPKAPQITLDSFSNVAELFVADPENVDRTWKAAPDLSVKVFLSGDPGRLRIRAEVRDDVEAASDEVRVFIAPPDGGAFANAELAKSGREGAVTSYEGEFSADSFGLKTFVGARFGVIAEDDDGRGLDLWMESLPGLRGGAARLVSAPSLAFPDAIMAGGQEPMSINPKGILELNPPETVLPILKNMRMRAIRRVKGAPPPQQEEQLVLLHFSDIHNDVVNLRRVMEFASHYAPYLDDVLLTGDIAGGDWSEWSEEMDAVPGFHRILKLLGNHDVCRWNGTPRNATAAESYDRYFKGIETWGVVQPDGDNPERHCYWYKDYPKARVRLIALDSEHDWPAQQAWLREVLDDALARGLAVLGAHHLPPAVPAEIERLPGCVFDSHQRESLGDRLAWATEIMDEFIKKGGEFICWLGGHTHCDFCGTVAEGRQLFMTVGIAKNDEIWGDMRRVTGEKSQDLFNIIAIDTHLKHIRVFRVGAEWSRFLQHRTTMCLDYAARKQVN